MKNRDEMITKILGVASALVALLLLFIAWVYTEVVWGIAAIAGVLVVLLGIMAYRNQKALRAAAGSRNVRYGANAMISTLLVVAIVMVLNFLNFNHYWKKDLTKDKVHTLSDQTEKIVKGLKDEVKLTAFVNAQGREQISEIIDNYRALNKKISAEYVDPNRQPSRAKAANIRALGTVIVEVGKKETRIDNLDEEKLTNALIKLSKDKTQTVCFLTGHGEKNPDGNEGDGYAMVKKEMEQSSWATKKLNLLEETKVPETCDVVLVLGPNKAFFDKEIDVLKAYLDQGGNALFALDPNVTKGEDQNKQLNALLSTWGVTVNHNVIVDPLSRLLGTEASVPVVASYNTESSITKEFQETTLFPLASSVEISKSAPAGLKVLWLAKSTPKAFGETNFKEMAAGRAQFNAGADIQGPLDMMASVEGKKSGTNATKDTRIVVLGTSSLATNAYARHARNIDLFLNAVSWLANDESQISIRKKEEGGQAITLSETEGRYIQLLTMVLVPLLTLGSGIVTFIRRRRL